MTDMAQLPAELIDELGFTLKNLAPAMLQAIWREGFVKRLLSGSIRNPAGYAHSRVKDITWWDVRNMILGCTGGRCQYDTTGKWFLFLILMVPDHEHLTYRHVLFSKMISPCECDRYWNRCVSDVPGSSGEKHIRKCRTDFIWNMFAGVFWWEWKTPCNSSEVQNSRSPEVPKQQAHIHICLKVLRCHDAMISSLTGTVWCERSAEKVWQLLWVTRMSQMLVLVFVVRIGMVASVHCTSIAAP